MGLSFPPLLSALLRRLLRHQSLRKEKLVFWAMLEGTLIVSVPSAAAFLQAFFLLEKCIWFDLRWKEFGQFFEVFRVGKKTSKNIFSKLRLLPHMENSVVETFIYPTSSSALSKSSRFPLLGICIPCVVSISGVNHTISSWDFILLFLCNITRAPFCYRVLWVLLLEERKAPFP